MLADSPRCWQRLLLATSTLAVSALLPAVDEPPLSFATSAQSAAYARA
jgi:hypothetical protein